jgi:type I restriction enzyme S subunit
MKEGWVIKKLKEIGVIQTGTTPSASTTDSYGNFIPFIKPALFNPDGTIKNGELGLSEKGAKNARIFQPNSVLMVCIGATIGKTAFAEMPVSANQQINALTPHEKYEPRFFYYALINDGFYKQVMNASSQATLPIINKSKWENLTVWLPSSKKEQQRIVSILDEAFAAIDKAKANIEKNIANAKELFQSDLNSIFSEKGQGWVEKKLNEIAFVKSGGTPSRSKTEYWRGAIPWYSSGELNDYYTRDSERFINHLAIENSNAKLFPKGSLLIGMYDTAALKMSILDREGTFNQAIAGVKPNQTIDLMFVMHAINSKRKAILEQRRGVRQKNLSLEKIKDITISLPPLPTQMQVVGDLKKIYVETNKLEGLYARKIVELEALKKSILQKAFSGELTQSFVPDEAIH